MSEKNAKEIQRAIVGIVTSENRMTVSDVAGRLGLRPHTVRYHLDQLLSTKQIMLSRSLNYRTFDWQIINVFFDLPRNSSKRAIDFLLKQSCVTWLACNIGPRGFEATIAVERHPDFMSLLSDLGENVGVHFHNPIVTSELEARYWGLRFLAKEYGGEPTTHFVYPAVTREFDSIDRKLFHLLTRVPGKSIRDLARVAGLAQTTVVYRLDRLRDWGAISDDIYFVRVDHEFVQAQVVLSLKARTKSFERTIVELCSREPYVEGLITGLGCWDYKIILRADAMQRLIEIEEHLLGAFGKNVARADMYIRNRILAGRAEASSA